MDSEILYRIILLVILLFFSGFFSGSEVAFFSLTPIFKKKASISHQRSQKNLIWLLRDPKRLIITLLLGNELVNILISTVSATLSEHLFTNSGTFSRTIFSIAVVVPIILIIGEITPKTIAISTAPGWASKVSTPLYLFSIIVTPFRLFFGIISNFFINIFGSETKEINDDVKEVDFLMLVEKGSKYGNINNEEGDLIKNVFQFGDMVVKNIMTPKEKIFSIDSEADFTEIINKFRKGTYSRVPVTKPRTGEILGILHAKDILAIEDSDKISLSDFISTPFYISQNTKCLRLLNEFQNRHIHIAVVLDENGKVAGIITLEDLLEELVGEIYDEKEIEHKGGH